MSDIQIAIVFAGLGIAVGVVIGWFIGFVEGVTPRKP